MKYVFNYVLFIFLSLIVMVGLSLVTCTAVFIMQPVGLSPSITVSAYIPYEIFHKTDLSNSLPPVLVTKYYA